MPNSLPFKTLVTALMLAATVSGPVLADNAAKDNNSVKEEVTVLPGRQITPQDEAAMSSAAAKVLRHIADARSDLRGDKPNMDKAKVELDQAGKLLDIIKVSLPTTKIKDHIWVAKKHLDYDNTREVLPDLIPIYASLNELVDYMPTSKARQHLDQAKEAMEKGNKPQAEEQLEAMGDALHYVEADLPLTSTRQLVAQARADLDKPDVKAASKALRTAEDNVVFISISFQSPIAQAKAALSRASEDYSLGDNNAAVADLNTAVGYLEHAAQGSDEVTRQAAEHLVSDVRDLHQLIENGDKDFSIKLQSAWLRTKALTERSTEYISTGWQRLRANGAGKKDLIEAKLQLAYARIDHLVTKDDAAAKVDLAEAKGYLRSASAQVRKSVKGDVADVSSLVKQLDKELQGTTPTDKMDVAFNKAEAHLTSLIQQL